MVRWFDSHSAKPSCLAATIAPKVVAQEPVLIMLRNGLDETSNGDLCIAADDCERGSCSMLGSGSKLKLSRRHGNNEAQLWLVNGKRIRPAYVPDLCVKASSPKPGKWPKLKNCASSGKKKKKQKYRMNGNGNLSPKRNSSVCFTHTSSSPSRFRSSSSCSISTEPYSTSDDSSINDADVESLTKDLSRMSGPGRQSSFLKSSKSYSELKWAEPPLPEALAEPSTLTVSFPNNATDDAASATVVPKRLPLDAATTALLVVDVQPQYWSECPSVRKDFPDFPRKLSQTIATCRQRGAKLIFVRADYRYAHSPWLAQFERLHGGRPDVRTEVPCDPNSEEFSWEEFATPEGGDVILPKTSWSSSSNPKLMKWLRNSGIDTVLVCGLITSVCVQHSAFSIFEAGFRTLLVTDACGDRGKARHDAALALYGDYMYELVTADDLDDPEHGLIKAKPVWLSLEPSSLPSSSPSPSPSASASASADEAENKSTISNSKVGSRDVGKLQESLLKTAKDKTGATVVLNG